PPPGSRGCHCWLVQQCLHRARPVGARLAARSRPPSTTPPCLHRARPGGATTNQLDPSRLAPHLHRARPGGATPGRYIATPIAHLCPHRPSYRVPRTLPAPFHSPARPHSALCILQSSICPTPNSLLSPLYSLPPPVRFSLTRTPSIG